MTHCMKLLNKPFQAIKAGEKTIEMRLYDEKRAGILIGDIITFTNVQTKEILHCRVTDLFQYPNFEELYNNHDKVSIGYTKDEEANPADMTAYYSKEQIEQYGVLGIELSVIENRLSIANEMNFRLSIANKFKFRFSIANKFNFRQFLATKKA